jgi:tRNA-uridine 2-sulfurtransferase
VAVAGASLRRMATVELIGDSARGDAYAAVRLVVDDDRIIEADASGLARPLEGLTLLEAAAVAGETLAADALADALGPVLTASADPNRVAVAMSGGVDSAVALHRAAPNAVGVTLRLWVDPHGPDVERVCCSPAAVVAAREACHDAGIPHVTLDLREEFKRAVVTPFVEGYAAGLTPNPCNRCNGSFRFQELIAFARRIGAAALWTGHYARIVERGGIRLVARGADRQKDQSYMLATVDPTLLESVGFPLGDQTKAQTRDEAAAAGLAAASRPESQEACFLAGGDYRAFLRRTGVADEPGDIVDESGTPVGRHNGVWGFTPGQRRGIRVGGREPLYAIRTEPSSATLVVGPRRSLACRELTATGRLYVPADRVAAKVRHRAPAAPATVENLTDGFRVRFDDPVDAVAPGQVVALYDDDAIVGAGVIATTA